MTNTITSITHTITFHNGSAVVADTEGNTLGTIVGGAAIVRAHDEHGRRLLVAVHTPEGEALTFRVSLDVAKALTALVSATLLQDGVPVPF